MSIFIDNSTTVVVQGITGRDGSFHARQMIEYGTKVVAGVTPGKGGQRFDDTVPIFNTVHPSSRRCATRRRRSRARLTPATPTSRSSSSTATSAVSSTARAWRWRRWIW